MSYSKFDKAALAAMMVAGVTVSLAFLKYPANDDPFITFRYAYNLAVGRGLVFNEGESFLGTTAPGYAVLLSILSLPWPKLIPIVANVVCGVSLIAGALGIFELSRVNRAPFLGLLAALFWITCPLVAKSFGGEMVLQFALVIWAFVLMSKRITIGASALAGIACIVRPDSAIAAVVIFCAMLIQERRLLWREAAVFGLIVVPFFAAIWIYYGSPIPGSIIAKSYQREMGTWPHFWPTATQLLRTEAIPYSASAWSGPRASPDMAAVLALIAAGAISLLAIRRFWIKPLIWSALVALMYTLGDPPAYPWYLVPLIWPLALLAAAGIDGLVQFFEYGFSALLKAEKPKWTKRGLQLGTLLLVAPALGHQLVSTYEAANPGRRHYLEISRWLNDNLPSGTKVAHFEIGYLSFYSPNLVIIDLLGLVHPDIARQYAQGDFKAAVKKYDPQVMLYYIVVRESKYMEPKFGDEFVRVARFPGPIAGEHGGVDYFEVFVKSDLARQQRLPDLARPTPTMPQR